MTFDAVPDKIEKRHVRQGDRRMETPRASGNGPELGVGETANRSVISPFIVHFSSIHSHEQSINRQFN